jgi:cellulose synthase/poly-beta-1,6-N-acetylglucosamine synthase-like glycosyltransferase
MASLILPTTWLPQTTAQEKAVSAFTERLRSEAECLLAHDDKWPRITIVTPTLNQARYIEHTILSVLNQGYPNLEYIILDGGSTDGTQHIIDKYARYLAYWRSSKDFDEEAEKYSPGSTPTTFISPASSWRSPER